MKISREHTFLLYACYFFIGFSLLSLEVIWGRLTSLPLGSSIHAYSITLAAVMAGLFCGTFHGNKVSGSSGVNRLFSYFLCFTLFSALVSISFVYLSEFFKFWRFTAGMSVKLAYYITLLQVCLSVFIPAFFSGAVFPVATQILVPDVDRAGRTAGYLYMVNSMGAIAGCMLTGFVLIEHIGLKNSAIFCSMLPALPAALFFLFYRPPAQSIVMLVAASTIIGAGIASNYPRIPYTLYMSQSSTNLSQFEQGTASFQILDEYESIHGITRVMRSSRSKFLHVNNKNESSFLGGDMPTQTLLALLPRVYLQSQPQTFLDIGLGTGTTLWVAEKWANHIDSIEINPDVYQAFQEHFFPQLKNSSKINYIFQEARYYLLNSGKKYDIIALEPSYPTDAMTASLYTRESFAQLRASLNVNGLVSLFVPLHVVGFKYAEGILKTLLTEFPYLQIWNIASGDDIVIVAGLKPFTLQPDEVIARIDQYSFPRFGSFGGSLQFAKRNAMLEQIKQSREIPIYTDDSITLELAATRGFLQQVEPKHSTLL